MKAGIVMAMIWVLLGLNIHVEASPQFIEKVKRIWLMDYHCHWSFMRYDSFGWGWKPGDREPAWRGSVTFGSAKSM